MFDKDRLDSLVTNLETSEQELLDAATNKVTVITNTQKNVDDASSALAAAKVDQATQTSAAVARCASAEASHSAAVKALRAEVDSYSDGSDNTGTGSTGTANYPTDTGVDTTVGSTGGDPTSLPTPPDGTSPGTPGTPKAGDNPPSDGGTATDTGTPPITGDGTTTSTQAAAPATNA